MNFEYIEKDDNDIVNIKTCKLPFLITKEKCELYLKLHYPDKEIIDDMLNKCNIIFNILIRYIDNYDRSLKMHSLWRDYNFWDSSEYYGILEPLYLFNAIFFNVSLSIASGSHKDKNIKHHLLYDLLTNDDEYNIFIDHYSKQYDYYDIYDVMKHVMNKYNMSNDLIDEIICLAI